MTLSLIRTQPTPLPQDGGAPMSLPMALTSAMAP
jgi:hypothetical protein